MKNALDLQHKLFLMMKPGFHENSQFADQFTAEKSVFDERMAIYRQSILLGLQNALIAKYPYCAQELGDELWQRLTGEFLMHHLPTTANLNQFGADFPDFLALQPGLPRAALLADLAQLEWLFDQIIYGVNNPLLSPQLWQEMINQYGDEIILLPPDGAVWFTSNYPLIDFWRVGQCLADESSEVYYFMIWQLDASRRLEMLSKAAYDFLMALSVEKNLLAVCDALTFEIDMQKILPELCLKGCLYPFS